MAIKILFFDTSALLKMFVREDGSNVVKWLTQADTRADKSLHFVINEQVGEEFVRKIECFSRVGRISRQRGEEVIRQFEQHCKGKYFRVIGQSIVSNLKPEVSIDEVFRDLKLTPGVDDWDGLIYQSIVNALAFLGGESHPFLVSCDRVFSNKVRGKGYRVIDPMRQSKKEIGKVLS